MNSSFKDFPPASQVEYLADALTGDAQRFFYEIIAPRLSRAAPDLADATTQKTATTDHRPNVLTLSAVLCLPNMQFFTREACIVLRKELVLLTFARLKQEASCDRADALRLLKRRIDRLNLDENNERARWGG